jgi:Spy/CpxP family protein refolding chaperone
MRLVRVSLIVAVALLMAGSVLAQEKKEGKRGPRGGGDPIQMLLRGITLTDEQKAKVDDIKKEYAPKLAEAFKKMDVRTDADKKAAADAEKAAKDAGKSRREIFAAGRDAVKLTDDQKKAQTDARQAMRTLGQEYRGKVMAILTPEQKEQVQKNLDEAKKARNKKKDS